MKNPALQLQQAREPITLASPLVTSLAGDDRFPREPPNWRGSRPSACLSTPLLYQTTVVAAASNPTSVLSAAGGIAP